MHMETAAEQKKAGARTNADGNTERLIEHEVDVDLDEKELVALGGEIADLELELREMEQEARDAMAERRKKIKARKATIKEKCEQRRAKKTTMKMQCVEIVEYPKRVAVYRLDLPGVQPGDPRALVSERPLTSEEAQTQLLDLGPPDPNAQAAAAGTPPGTVTGGRKKKPKGDAPPPTEH